MEPITMILTALAAAASAGVMDGLKEEVKETAKGAVQKLHKLLGERFHAAGTPNGDAVLSEYAEDPETYAKPLEKKLEAVDAGADEAVVAAAQQILELLQPAGNGNASKYNVNASGAKGVAIGDGNTQTFTFN